MTFDIVVGGGGSAGCVLASGLSEDTDRNVVLLEAGSDCPDVATVPADVLRCLSHGLRPGLGAKAVSSECH
jgi:choline dehydrogenase-like flavoprotein